MRLFIISVLLSLLLTNCPTDNNSELVDMTASVNPEEAGTVQPPQGTYSIGQEITVSTEASDDRWEFTGWSGDTTASDDSLTFAITRNMDLVANYEIPSDAKPVVTTTSVPLEGGIVEPDSAAYEFGASVGVEALPAEGWRFVEWTDDTASTTNPLTLTMNKDYNLTANFEQLPTLATTIKPSEGGSVNPSSGTFEFGESVDIEAVPSDGWEFIEWSGDTSATANPLTITMDTSYSVTANFEQLAQAFSNQITVSDGDDNMNLTFGMDANATSGFDSGIDRDLPPPPPEGSFYAQFNIPDYNLAEDYRAVRKQETIWELEFSPDSGQSISLNWDFSNSNHVGSLTLTDDPENPSFEVDMKSNTSHDVADTSTDTLYIISEI